MALYIGKFTNKLDGKGRVSLPSSYRLEMQKTPELKRLNMDEEYPHGFVYLYPSPRKEGVLEGSDHFFFNELEQYVAGLDYMSEARDMFEEYYFGRAERLGLDDTGRFMIPKAFRDHIHFDGTNGGENRKEGNYCVFVGRRDRFEIHNQHYAEAVTRLNTANSDGLKQAWAKLNHLRSQQMGKQQIDNKGGLVDGN